MNHLSGDHGQGDSIDFLRGVDTSSLTFDETTTLVGRCLRWKPSGQDFTVITAPDVYADTLAEYAVFPGADLVQDRVAAETEAACARVELVYAVGLTAEVLGMDCHPQPGETVAGLLKLVDVLERHLCSRVVLRETPETLTEAAFVLAECARWQPPGVSVLADPDDYTRSVAERAAQSKVDQVWELTATELELAFTVELLAHAVYLLSQAVKVYLLSQGLDATGVDTGPADSTPTAFDLRESIDSLEAVFQAAKNAHRRQDVIRRQVGGQP